MRLLIFISLLFFSSYASAQKLLHRAITGNEDTITVTSLSSIGVYRAGVVYQQAVTYSDEALALFERMPNDLTTLDKVRIDNAITALKANNLWQKIYVLQVYASNTYRNSLVNWMGNWCNGTLGADSLQFDTHIGWTGNLSHYINTGYNDTDTVLIKKNNNQTIIYARQLGTASNNYIDMGNYTGTLSASTFLNLKNISGYATSRYGGVSITSDQNNVVGYIRLYAHLDSCVMQNNNKKVLTSQTFTWNNKNYYINARNYTTIAASDATISLFVKSLTFSDAEYVIFQGIMNEYFEDLDYWAYKSIKEYHVVSGETDSYAKIQSAISVGGNVMLGSGGEMLNISKPIRITEYGNYKIESTIEISDGFVRDLTANVDSGQNYVKVANADDYFVVGQQVTVSDTDCAKQGGSTQTRKIGNAFTVVSVATDSVVFDITTDRAFTVAASAKIGHTQSVINVDTANSVTIFGNGIINANKNGQYDVEPVIPRGQEQTRFGCGISVNNSDSVTIEGLTVKNGLLHNINLKYANNHLINDCIADSAHDKNILVWHSNNGTISNSTVKNADFEDGITYYLHVDNATLENVIAEDNPRNNISWNSIYNDTLYVTDIRSLGVSEYGFSISSKQVHGNGIYSENAVSLRDNYEAVGIYLDNVTIKNSTNNYQLQLIGNVKDVEINNLIIDGCTGTAIYSIDGVGSPGTPPENVLINGGGITNHTGTKTSLVEGSDITFTNFTGL